MPQLRGQRGPYSLLGVQSKQLQGNQADRYFLDSLSPQIVHLAGKIAERILTREIRHDSEAVIGIVRSALKKILDEEGVRLHVNPEDVETLRAHRVTLLEEFDAVKIIEIIADEGVTSGGCIAESERLYIDAQLESQLTEILATILDESS